MDLDAIAAASDTNLAHTWAVMGGHARFDVSAVDTVTLSASGLPIAFFNGAFTAAPTSDPDSAVAAVIEFFRPRQVPYLLWVREGVDHALLAAARRAGLRDVGGPPAMGLADLASFPAAPANLVVTLAANRDDIDEHRTVLAAGFGLPMEVAHRVAASTLRTDPDVAIAIGRVDGVAVCTAMLVRSGATAGVYSVATVPGHRGKGYGEALTWAVIAEGARRGCTHAVLQASQMGEPVYRRMGFVSLGQCVQLEGPPAP